MFHNKVKYLIIIINIAIFSFFISPSIGWAVYECGGVTDDCNCGVSNDFPCCSNGGNCTWWAWHKVCCNWGHDAAYDITQWIRPRDAHTWDDQAENSSIFTVSNTPAPNTIAVREAHSDNYYYGHVAWVESVNGSDVTVTEMMCDVSWGGYRTRTYSASYFDGGYINIEETGYASISQGVTVTPTPVVLGQNFTVSFTLKETNGAPITFEHIEVAIHRSDGSYLQRVEMYDNVSIGANGTWSRSPTSQLNGISPGTYRANVSGVVPGGNWFDFSVTDSGVNPRSFTVENPVTLSYITISGSTQVNESSGAQYTCTAYYSDGSSSNVTSSASWSENSSYAGISSSGYLTTYSVSSDQSCTITASYGGKSDTHNVTIKNIPPTLSYITISGSTQVNENSGAQYTCTAYYSDGSNSNVTSSASWSENSSYASISSNGYLTTSSVSSDQSCTITATYGGKSDTHSVTIKNVPATLSYITISGSTQVNENSGAQYACTAYYSDGSNSNVTSSSSWSENSSYASISSSGYLTTSSVSSDQSCTITATYGGKSDTHNVTIKNIPATLPTVTTTAVSSITSNSASSGGNVTSDGGAFVTARGVCWNTSANPTTSDSHTTDDTGTGSFTSSITGLSPNTTYHVRAYATNSEGAGYGNDQTFTTQVSDPACAKFGKVIYVYENNTNSTQNYGYVYIAPRATLPNYCYYYYTANRDALDGLTKAQETGKTVYILGRGVPCPGTGTYRYGGTINQFRTYSNY